MVESKRILLAVLAHPDDETFGTGGTLAYYASKGVDVHLVCATRGEVGEASPEMMAGFQSVAEMREYELAKAAKILGLASVNFLGYRDSGMQGSADNRHPQALAAAPLDEVAKKVVGYIRKLKPQVVITFDPMGGYNHPDHVAIHKATVAAFYAAADPKQYPELLKPFSPAKLFFNTFPRGFLRWAVFFMKLLGKDPRKFGKNGDIDLNAVAQAKFPINAVVDYKSVMDVKDQAAACHASQGGARITKGVMGWFRKIFGVNETYMRAYPAPGKRREKDLFEGI